MANKSLWEQLLHSAKQTYIYQGLGTGDVARHPGATNLACSCCPGLSWLWQRAQLMHQSSVTPDPAGIIGSFGWQAACC
jgi:hypothetical protein